MADGRLITDNSRSRFGKSSSYSTNSNHINVLLGLFIIILNNVEDARALFDKRSSIYSDRPVFEMGGELVGWKYILALTPYGARFREYRRFIARLIGAQRQVQENVWPVQERETRRFLLRLLRAPERFDDHVRWCVRSFRVFGRC